MKKIFEFFSQRHILASLFTITIILLGLNSARTLKRDIIPEVDFGEMIITTVYPGASPEDVELNVTNKIEEELKAVGPRVIDTERIINVREGLVKAWDSLPKRYFDDPMPMGQAKGQHIDREQFAAALARYYKMRGWNEDGRVTEERREELEGIA